MIPASSVTLKFCLLATLLTGCGTDESPLDPDLAPLVGTWEALVFTVIHENEDLTVDLLASGAAFELRIESNGRYAATLTTFGIPNPPERGRITVSGSHLTLDPDDGDPTVATWSLSGGILTLDGPTEFDFNLDGKLEAATAHIELVRA